jgi:hypothetical protein
LLHWLGLVCLSLAFAATAGATKPAAASGIVESGTIEFAGFHEEGGNQFVDISGTGVVTGTFSGPQRSEYDEVVNPTGNSTLQGSLDCDPCTVAAGRAPWSSGRSARLWATRSQSSCARSP